MRTCAFYFAQCAKMSPVNWREPLQTTRSAVDKTHLLHCIAANSTPHLIYTTTRVGLVKFTARIPFLTYRQRRRDTLLETSSCANFQLLTAGSYVTTASTRVSSNLRRSSIRPGVRMGVYVCTSTPDTLLSRCPFLLEVV